MGAGRNHHRGEPARTEHGPRYESKNPGSGSNSTHVARSRRRWKRIANRTERRTGQTSKAFYAWQGPRVRPDE